MFYFIFLCNYMMGVFARYTIFFHWLHTWHSVLILMTNGFAIDVWCWFRWRLLLRHYHITDVITLYPPI
jgi:hypothetical protein